MVHNHGQKLFSLLIAKCQQENVSKTAQYQEGCSRVPVRVLLADSSSMVSLTQFGGMSIPDPSIHMLLVVLLSRDESIFGK